MNIFTLADLAKCRKQLANVVLAGGVFDILHAGHIQHLVQAKEYGEILIVHVVGNERVREKKGAGKPLLDQMERAHIIAALRCVDYVFVYNGRHYDQEIIEALKPDILFFNQEGYTPAVMSKVAELKQFAGKIVVDEQLKINSSSKIIEKVREIQGDDNEKEPRKRGSSFFKDRLIRLFNRT